MRQRHGVAIDHGPTRPSALSRAVDAPASEAAAVMDQIRSQTRKLKNDIGSRRAERTRVAEPAPQE